MELKDRIVAAFKRCPLSSFEEKLVQVLASNRDTTAAGLTAAIGAKGNGAWQLHFGQLCRKREADLGPAPAAPGRRTPDGKEARFYTGLLADWQEDSRTFAIKAEARQAFVALGVI
ncbi:hypothetical protein [Mesorhizobium sp. B2-3-15]|uniref:hypothetical protein n=1 Tax=Mesorhizobium sp. B2-3-15 TaxID=2589949 RepID=UPI00112887BA|nr:hypothetical protein [Mesorhizobium sp. B2-3-15]